jgi:hypothetical protein
MSRKKSQEEMDIEAEKEDLRISEMAKAQRECAHWNCAVTEWWFSGKPRQVQCLECGKENFIDEDDQ